MLHSLWLETLSHYRDRPALIAGGRVWSFGELEKMAAGQERAQSLVFVRGTPLEILLGVLKGWRGGVPVSPLEKDATLPALPAEMPAGTAHVKWTPGIEGAPRAVFFNAEQIAADAARLVAAMELRPGIPNVAAVSLTHSYGFSNLILPLLLHGVPIHAVDMPFPQVVAEALRAHEAVTVPAVPSMWKAWLRSGILTGAKIATAISAGAPLSLELEHAVYESCGLKLHNFYGASECGGISYDACEKPRSEATDLGSSLDGVEVKLSGAGRFLVRSSSVALGCQTQREGEILGGGEFLTQDCGRIEGGRLVLESSGADSINVAGRKIGPAKIEAVLTATGMVRRVRIFGVASLDRERVEEITALVELRSDVTLETLRLAATERLAGWEVPRHWLEHQDAALWGLSRAELKRRFPFH